ncbi:hypothetical protein [Lentilactobacillus parakefiri]|uniref:Uncharacterized protein n=1 Tax=Lentilactobacillus parakefiri TaxID=152332 RepID=A0A269YEW1_9LACO|nr:hypothetical protein [Lentilactobacillus parakefiri]KRL57543.1 hypothetical protein FD08_GL004036 [Lentilactobacillus parakefiri DSM 10551]PAK83186.1 hypothetical protein B8W98_07050 [Lentilactobacillus parakefiri]TDG95098.1 hypothetical protein C5L28_002618 [Lentilactobacillus parakefiri]GAW73195.1 hypothetical protein LPKJCM_02337 [Lentilactobacillus parakefiri]
MIIMLLILFLVGSLILNLSWFFIKTSAWLILLLIGLLLLSKLLIIGLIVAAVYGIYLLYQRAQVQPYKNRH